MSGLVGNSRRHRVVAQMCCVKFTLFWLVCALVRETDTCVVRVLDDNLGIISHISP